LIIWVVYHGWMMVSPVTVKVDNIGIGDS